MRRARQPRQGIVAASNGSSADCSLSSLTSPRSEYAGNYRHSGHPFCSPVAPPTRRSVEPAAEPRVSTTGAATVASDVWSSGD
jgi:hypothetical protein